MRCVVGRENVSFKCCDVVEMVETFYSNFIFDNFFVSFRMLAALRMDACFFIFYFTLPVLPLPLMFEQCWPFIYLFIHSLERLFLTDVRARSLYLLL